MKKLFIAIGMMSAGLFAEEYPKDFQPYFMPVSMEMLIFTQDHVYLDTTEGTPEVSILFFSEGRWLVRLK